MSKESAKEFVKRLQEDKTLYEKLGKLDNKEDWTGFVRQEGFDFDRAELMDAASELNAMDVAGGKCCGIRCENYAPCQNVD